MVYIFPRLTPMCALCRIWGNTYRISSQMKINLYHLLKLHSHCFTFHTIIAILGSTSFVSTKCFYVACPTYSRILFGSLFFFFAFRPTRKQTKNQPTTHTPRVDFFFICIKDVVEAKQKKNGAMKLQRNHFSWLFYLYAKPYPTESNK